MISDVELRLLLLMLWRLLVVHNSQHHMNPPLYVYMLPLLIVFLSFFFLSLLLTFILVSNRRLVQVNLGQTRHSSLQKKIDNVAKKNREGEKERANVHLNHAEKRRQRDVERCLDDDDQSRINENSRHSIPIC